MTMLTTDAVAEIKAAKDVYRAADVARNYQVHRSTVKRIWDGQIHTDVSPAPDFPDLTIRYRPSDLAEDIAVLAGRGMKPREIAQELGISVSAVWQMRGVWV